MSNTANSSTSNPCMQITAEYIDSSSSGIDSEVREQHSSTHASTAEGQLMWCADIQRYETTKILIKTEN